MPLLLLFVCLLTALGLWPATGHAQPIDDPGARRTVRAVRLPADEHIVLDGRLDEPIWKRIEPAANFIQVDPLNGLPATEPTEVRIAFSGDTFYMGVTCFDSEPDRWIGYQRRRDEFLPADDRFMWTIDTFLDTRTGYFFEMNPSGLMADSLMGINGDNRQWDGIWNARVTHTDIGWTIEIAIPFRTLNFNPTSDTWGINFQRTVRRKNEDSIWMGWPRNQGLRRMTNAGHVTGLTDVTQGHGLDIKPYGLATSDERPTGGLDLFYNPTPLLRANLTLNTDFAQTEVDQRQVNLTRFSLFFPEKRDFFLDGATSFDFASPGGDLIVNPFFSRRIGLSEGGTTQPIAFGTKLTGQLGGQDVGVLHVRTADEDGLMSEDFTVARVKRRMLRQSYIGAMYTRRSPDVGEASHTAGIDLRLATTQFRGSQNLEASAWFLHAMNPGVTSGNSAFGTNIVYPNDRWDARFEAREVQANFRPEVGFVTRRDYRRYQPSLTFAPRPGNSRVVRRFVSSLSLDAQTTLGNDLLTRTFNATLLEAQLQSQDSFGIGAQQTRERLDSPFEATRGVVPGGVLLPAGSVYDFSRVRFFGQTANRRVIALNARYERGGYYSGQRDQKVMQLTIRARPGYILYLNGEWNDVRLPEARFSLNVYRVVAETQFTPFIALVNNIQYDNSSRVLGWQSRFRWIITPGTDAYVVYTHNFVDDPLLDRFATLDKRFATKFLYTYRF